MVDLRTRDIELQNRGRKRVEG